MEEVFCLRNIHSKWQTESTWIIYYVTAAVMLHAVKYLLIAMQFPQVHKKDFMMMMLGETWIELSNSYEEDSDHRLFHDWKCTTSPSLSTPLLTLKIYNLQLNFKPLKVLCNPFPAILKWFNCCLLLVPDASTRLGERTSPESKKETFKNTLRLVSSEWDYSGSGNFWWILFMNY